MQSNTLEIIQKQLHSDALPLCSSHFSQHSPCLFVCLFVPHQCPIDTRKVLSENLVIIGGTAMLPGFLHRLLAEIRSLVEKPKYRDALATKSFRIHSPPAKPNCTAWLGGEHGFTTSPWDEK